MSSAVVMLSAGLDSTVNLYSALRECDVKKVLTFDYGQRAVDREIENSQKICSLLNLNHEIIELAFFKKITKSSLVNSAVSVPQGASVQIENLSVSQETARQVWVPNRNGVFVSVAATYAEALGIEYVIAGFNKEEAATFPDNSAEFVKAANFALSFSTANRVRLKSYTIEMNKKQIVQLGRELRVPFQYLWSCYLSDPQPCGQCESCLRLERALAE